MAREDKRKNKNPNAGDYLNCQACSAKMARASRAAWRCGLLAPHERERPPTTPATQWGFPSPPKWGHTREDVCPGYLITLPQVLEAAVAHRWWDKGQLDQRFPPAEQTPLLVDCIDILDSEIGAVEQDMMDRLNKNG